MAKIAALLDKLAQQREQLEHVLNLIDIKAGPLAEQRDCLEADNKALEDEIKTAAKFIGPSQAHTLAGQTLQLVWKPASETQVVNAAALAALAERHGIAADEIQALYETKVTRSACWAINKRAKK